MVAVVGGTPTGATSAPQKAFTKDDLPALNSPITVTSSGKNYDLRIRSAPATYPNGKAKNSSSTEMINTFQFATAAGGPFTPISSTYTNVFSNQPKGTNINQIVYYRQCVDWGDGAGNYTIQADYAVVEL